MPEERYGATAQILHWLTVALIVLTMPIGVAMTADRFKPWQDPLFITHKAVGVLLLLIVLFRIGWRLTHPAPPLPDTMPSAQRRAAVAVHWLLYAMVLTMALSGYTLTIAGGFPIEVLNWLGVPPLLARNEPLAEVTTAVHVYGKYVLIALVAGHVAAALHHLLIRRDGVFDRMWPIRRTHRPAPMPEARGGGRVP